MKSVQYLLALGVALIVLWSNSGAVSADDGVRPHDAASAIDERGEATLFGRPAVDESRLAGQRGGADMQLSKILANGTVSEIGASDLVTGSNIVTNGALSGVAGLPMLIQNSGNGVLIQNAVIVNVEVK